MDGLKFEIFENGNELAIPLLGIKVLGSFGIKDECPQKNMEGPAGQACVCIDSCGKIDPKQHA